MIIAIDGPAGAGKSTVARALAERFGFAYVDTGAMYRAVALAAAEGGLVRAGMDEDGAVEDGAVDDAGAIARLARELPIRLRDNGRRVFIGERDVSEAIRTPAIGALTSRLAALPEVREVVAGHQRRLAEQSGQECGGAVLEGRDIQTVVCPDAEVKVFLTAAAQTRAARRLEQWQQKGQRVSLDEAQQDVSTRDERDSSREASPLRAAPDALILETDGLSAEQVVERIVRRVEEVRGGWPSD